MSGAYKNPLCHEAPTEISYTHSAYRKSLFRHWYLMCRRWCSRQDTEAAYVVEEDLIRSVKKWNDSVDEWMTFYYIFRCIMQAVNVSFLYRDGQKVTYWNIYTRTASNYTRCMQTGMISDRPFIVHSTRSGTRCHCFSQWQRSTVGLVHGESAIRTCTSAIVCALQCTADRRYGRAKV